MEKTTTRARVGLFATGLDTYWGQFDGLRDHLNAYREEIAAGIGRTGDVEVVDAGMVDSPEKAFAAASLLAQKEVDLVFLYVATYCLSSTILPVAQRIGGPVIVLNLHRRLPSTIRRSMRSAIGGG